MRIRVTVKPNARQEKIEKLLENEYRVWVKESPVDGKANAAVTLLLARHFGVSQSAVLLQRGATSKHKVFEISDYAQ